MNDNDIKIDRSIEEFLNKYTIAYSTDLEKEKTLKILKQYLSVKRKANKIKTIKSLLELTLNEQISTCKYQYALASLLLLAFLLLDLSISPYLAVFFTAPVPSFIGFWNIYGRANSPMMELEKTYKFSYYEMLCSRIVTLTYTSILFLSLPLGYIIIIGHNVQSLSIFKLIISGLTPIFIFSAFLLFVASTYREDNLFAISCLCWGAIGFTAVSTPFGEWMFHLHILVYILIIAASTAWLVTGMIRALRIPNGEMVNV